MKNKFLSFLVLITVSLATVHAQYDDRYDDDRYGRNRYEDNRYGHDEDRSYGIGFHNDRLKKLYRQKRLLHMAWRRALEDGGLSRRERHWFMKKERLINLEIERELHRERCSRR